MHFKDDLQYKVLYSIVFGIKPQVSTPVLSALWSHFETRLSKWNNRKKSRNQHFYWRSGQTPEIVLNTLPTPRIRWMKSMEQNRSNWQKMSHIFIQHFDMSLNTHPDESHIYIRIQRNVDSISSDVINQRNLRCRRTTVSRFHTTISTTRIEYCACRWRIYVYGYPINVTIDISPWECYSGGPLTIKKTTTDDTGTVNMTTIMFYQRLSQTTCSNFICL
jgi:hypothetical protein